MQDEYVVDVKTGLQVHCKTVRQLCKVIGITPEGFNRWCRIGLSDVQKLRINLAYKKLCGEDVRHWEL